MDTPDPRSRFVLLPREPAPWEPADARVRRYRLARVRVAEVREERERFAHLRRTYD